MLRFVFVHLVVSLVPLLSTGCADSSTAEEAIVLATTTSTRDSGLLDAILPPFEERTGIDVQVVAVGSGQALELGRRGDADVLLTHAPEAEVQFVRDGYGDARVPVMYNDFILVGTDSDPAEVATASSITAALRRIAASGSPFVSRGDDSGTHMKELALWKMAERIPQGDWYVSAGAGMAATLRIASEKEAYTLSDRSTFLSQQQLNRLGVVYEGDPLLQNPYAAIVVSQGRHPHVRKAAANRFVSYLLDVQTQETIGKFGVEQHHQPLFFTSESMIQHGN